MQQSRPYKGIAFKVLSTMLFVVMSALIRKLSYTIPVGEVVFARSLFALVPLFLVAALQKNSLKLWQTNYLKNHITRGSVGVISMFFTFSALFYLPLAEVNAISFASPLFLVIFAALFLGEKVRIYRWAAVGFGFVGVVIMMSPQLKAFQAGNVNEGAFYALAGAFFAALAYVEVRKLTAKENTEVIVFYFSVISTLAGLMTIVWGWRWPSPFESALLIATGLSGGLAQIAMTQAYRFADASLVAGFEYTSLIWAGIAGYVIFGELPSTTVLAGAAIVIATGLFVIYREHKLGLKRENLKPL